MFVLKNAWAAVVRRKWRTLLAILVTLIVSFGSMFGLAVLEENEVANTTAYDAQTPTATIRLTDEAYAERDGADPSWADENLLTWSDYTNYATYVQAMGLSFEYTLAESIPVRQTDSIQAIATGDADADSDDTGGELTLQSFYTLDAAQANETGRYEVVEGKHLSYSGNAPLGALISREVANANGLEVGDTITVGDPSDADTTYDLTVRGIYEYVDDDAPEGRGDDAALSKDNRVNAIYVSYYTFAAVLGLDTTSGTGWSTPDLNIIFTLGSPSYYDTFVETIEDNGLADGYEITSPTLEAYAESIAPLGTLADTMQTVLLVTWIAGGVILLALTIANVRRRRDEIGMAMVVGVSKVRLGWQFMLETWIPIIPAFAIGALAGGFASGPLGAALADGHETTILAAQVWQVIWYGLGACLVLAIVAMLRVATFPVKTLFDQREGVEAGDAGGVDAAGSDDADMADGADGDVAANTCAADNGMSYDADGDVATEAGDAEAADSSGIPDDSDDAGPAYPAATADGSHQDEDRHMQEGR